MQQEQAMLSPVSDSFIENTIAAAPVKKKLKVVHINELGEPVSEAPNTARYYEHRPLQFRFINQQVYTSSSLPLNSTGFTIFKTKSVPSN